LSDHIHRDQTPARCLPLTSFFCLPANRTWACCSRSAVTRALHSPQCHPRPIPAQVAIGSAVLFGISCADWRNSDIPAVDVQSRYIDCEDVQVCELTCNGLVLSRERHNIARGQVSIKPGRAPIVYSVTARLPLVRIHFLQHPGFLLHAPAESPNSSYLSIATSQFSRATYCTAPAMSMQHFFPNRIQLHSRRNNKFDKPYQYSRFVI
jgi:hypothetical protein